MNKILSRRKAAKIQAGGGYVLQVITVVRGLLLIPLYISFIGDRLYGLWLASGGVLVWLTMLDLGLGRGLNQRIASHYGKKDYRKTGDFFINGLLIYGGLALLFLFIGYVISFPVPGWLKADISEVSILRSCFQLAVIAGVMKILNDVLRGFATSMLRPLFSILSMLTWSLIGLATTVFLLFKDVGLWSIPIGHLVNHGGLIIFNGGYAFVLLKKLGGRFRIRKTILEDLMQLTPSLFGSRIGKSLVGSVEPTLITIILYPELATAFTITRRAADFVSQGLHIIMGSSFPGFAHLVGEGNIKKTAEIVRLIMSIALFGSFIGFGTYIVGNGSFVKLWIGEKFYLGQSITVLIATGIMIRVIHDFVSEILVGAGDIIFSSYLVLAESVARVLAMAALIYFIGIYGAPLGMIVTCSIFAIVLGKRLYKRIDKQPILPPSYSLILLFSITAVIVTLFTNFLPEINSWFSFFILLIIIFLSLSIASMVNGTYKHTIVKIIGWKLIPSSIRSHLKKVQ